MKGDHVISSISVIFAVVAIVATVFIRVQLQGEIANRKKLERLILGKEPKVEFLEPFIQSTAEAFWVIVPIINSSISTSGVAHRVEIAVTFSPDNPIQKINVDPFGMVDEGEASHSVTLTLSVLYPRSVIYTSFLVEKKEIPEILIDWAEKMR